MNAGAARRGLSIRTRLTLWYAAILAATLVAFSGFLYLSLSHSLYAGVDRTLTTQASQLQPSIRPKGDEPMLGDAARRLPPDSVVALYDPTGEALLTGTPRWPAEPLSGALAQAEAGSPALSTVSDNAGDRWRVLVTPVVEHGQTVGLLEVGQRLYSVEAALARLLLLIGLAVPATLLLAAGGGLFLANRALGPIDRITRTARRIGAGDLSQRIGLPPTADEVGRLAETFDGMLERLEQAFARQRRFTADAAHELRTPLAIMAGQIDVALERPRSASEYTAALAGARAEVEQMRGLVAGLLTLARADAGQEPLAREPVALDELAADVAGQMAPLAQAGGLQLQLDAPEAVTVLGDRTHLQQLALNLLDNACKYTPAGGQVRIAVGEEAGWATLAVADSGVGISAEHLPHLFERFYRADEARSRAEGGAGLGLAICDWVARAHGGRIEATSAPGQGSTFTVYLPRGRRAPWPSENEKTLRLA